MEETKTFGELADMQQEMGQKAYLALRRAEYRKQQAAQGKTGARKKRLDKNRPQEVTSKRPVKLLRQVLEEKKRVCRHAP